MLQIVDMAPQPTAETVRVPFERPDWHKRAACRGLTELFFPSRGRNATLREAKQICEGCPVVAECRAQALANAEHFGIWGGTSDRQRRLLRRQMKRVAS